MILASKHDIEAPSADVFKALTDFDHWERASLRRGADVHRTDDLTKLGVGMQWQTRFAFRGKTRDVEVLLRELAAKQLIVFNAKSKMIEGDIRFEIVEMSTKRTRLNVTVDIKPVTLGARLFLQSLRLARQRVDKKFSQRVAQLALDIETRVKSNVAFR
jgi:carbon monoxide dehydrogenase subunit G